MSRGRYRVCWYRRYGSGQWRTDVWDTTSYRHAVARGVREAQTGASHFEVLTLREPRP